MPGVRSKGLPNAAGDSVPRPRGEREQKSPLAGGTTGLLTGPEPVLDVLREVANSGSARQTPGTIAPAPLHSVIAHPSGGTTCRPRNW